MTTLTQDIKDARRVAFVKGWHGGHGGWIYDSHGKPICQGWQTLASRLRAARVIGQESDGGFRQIDWQRLHVLRAWRNR